jgi:hypothetical protein
MLDKENEVGASTFNTRLGSITTLATAHINYASLGRSYVIRNGVILEVPLVFILSSSKDDVNIKITI